MSNNTLTLALNGDVSLDEFARTMQHFTALVDALSRDIGPGVEIDWMIDDLQADSAIATVMGVSTQEGMVEKVVRAYANVGEALEKGEPIPYSSRVEQEATEITKVLNGRITSIRFETAQSDATIVGRAGLERPGTRYAFGTVRGTVETLTRRRGLRITLYDAIFDKAVACYLSEGLEDVMRKAWGQRVVVAGEVGREPETGRPVVVRNVKYIKPLEDVVPGSYKRARGVLPAGKSDEKPEDIIRRVRDAS
jgi:hypothetical protein